MIDTIKQNAIKNEVPIIKDGGLQFILDYILNNNVKDILELGTAVGYSSICMASLNPDIRIDTIEKNEEMYNQAIVNISSEGLANQINVIFNDIDNVELDKKYDLIFVDAAKAQYGKYLEHFLPNLKQDGVVIFDNMIFHSLIYNIDNIKSKNLRNLVKKISKFRETIKDDSRFIVKFYDNIGDGILTLKRKPMSEKNELLKGIIKDALVYMKENNIDIDDIDTDFSDVVEHLKNSEDYKEVSKEYQDDLIKSENEAKEIINDEKPDEEVFIDEDDDFLKTIQSAVSNIQEEDKPKEEVKADIPVSSDLDETISSVTNNEYLNGLLDDLKDNLKNNKYINNAYQELKTYYHNLSDTFIKSLYDSKKSINNKYKFYKSVIVIHRIGFKDLDTLHNFVTYLASMDYSFNANDDKLIVDILMEIENGDGKIAYVIFDIADKAVGRNGEYLGYSVLDPERQTIIE